MYTLKILVAEFADELDVGREGRGRVKNEAESLG